MMSVQIFFCFLKGVRILGELRAAFWFKSGTTSKWNISMSFQDNWVLEVSKNISVKFSLHFWKKKIEFVCFPHFYEPTNDLQRTKNIWTTLIIYQNHQKSTNVDLFSNSYDRSLEYLLKYLGYDLQGHTIVFDKIMIFWSQTDF